MTPHYWDEAKTALAAADPVMGQLIASYPGEGLATRRDAFYTLARSIVGQQVSVKAADAIWLKCTAALEAMQPAAVLQAQDEHLRACGLSRQKVLYLKEISRFFHDNNVDEAYFAALPDDEVLKRLVSIKGIGVWTAEMFMIFHLLRPDMLPLDDIGLQRAAWQYYGAHFPDLAPKTPRKAKFAALSQLGERWRPWRTLATWYLWRALDPVPVEY